MQAVARQSVGRLRVSACWSAQLRCNAYADAGAGFNDLAPSVDAPDLGLVTSADQLRVIIGGALQARTSAQACRPGELPGWVENSQSLPLINQTSGTLFSLLSRYAPSVPLGPGEQQQGSLPRDRHSPMVAPGGNAA